MLRADDMDNDLIRASTKVYVQHIMYNCFRQKDAPKMVLALKKSGFSVTRLPMVIMTKIGLNEWVQEVRESWDEKGL